MKSLKNKYHNLKFRKKTMIAFLCVSMIPLFLLGSFCFFETRSLLISQAKKNLSTSLEQAALTINSQLESYNKISSALCYNKSLAIAANMDYDTPYAMFEQLKYTIDELFITTQNLASGINGITLYTDTNLPPHGKTVASIKDAHSLPWYSLTKDFVSSQWYPDGDALLCIQPILYNKISAPQENIVALRIEPSQIFRAATLLGEREIGVLITNRNKEVLFEASPYVAASELLLRMNDSSNITIGNNPYTIMKSHIAAADWNMVIYLPNYKLTQAASLITFTVIVMILFCFILVYLCSHLFSKRMVYRIEDLRENMKAIENGTLEVTITCDTSDEIGELIQGFDHMVRQIDHLIQENYTAQIMRKEFEMKALQAQINPHFLYNSLSLINWRALRIHAEDISEMAQLLSSFYRTTLNKGSNLISVSDELLNVQSYTRIQLIMHDNSFDANYQIMEDISEYRMPNLMLQPLVENAILHGIENKESVSGKILLTCKKEDNCLIFTVEDNGIGISKEELPFLLTKTSKGYGIKNVNERAKLLFGDDYGLTITSTLGEGTVVMLKIPLETH